MKDYHVFNYEIKTLLKILNSSPHSEIVKQCKANDRKAQYELYNLYSKAMYNVSIRMMKDEGLAEDALQMAFVKIFQNINSFKEESTIGAWIKRIVINTCISELNKKKLEIEEIGERQIENPTTVEDDTNYDIDSVRKAIMALPEGYRVIFSMYAVEGYDHQEIAEVMGISIGTSKSQYSRAKTKLREILKDQNRISNAS